MLRNGIYRHHKIHKSPIRDSWWPRHWDSVDKFIAFYHLMSISSNSWRFQTAVPTHLNIQSRLCFMRLYAEILHFFNLKKYYQKTLFLVVTAHAVSSLLYCCYCYHKIELLSFPFIDDWFADSRLWRESIFGKDKKRHSFSSCDTFFFLHMQWHGMRILMEERIRKVVKTFVAVEKFLYSG